MGSGAALSPQQHEVWRNAGAPARDPQRGTLYLEHRLPMARPSQRPAAAQHGAWLFVRWHCDGVLDRLHFELYRQVRDLEGRHASPTTAIVDSQSVKSAEKGGGTSTRSATTRPRRSRARSATSSSTRWA